MEGFEVIGLRLDLAVMMWLTIGGFALAALLFGLGILVDAKARYADGEFAYVVAAIVAFFSVVIAIIWLILLIPYKPVYHHWYSASGTVESVTNIFEGGSGEISPGYVVELDSVDRPLMFNDPRILKADGEINVACSVEWVPAGVDRLNCWIAN